MTKWNCQVTRAADIPAALAKAFYIARSGRPGPVLVDITKDAQFEEFDLSYEKCTKVRSYVPTPKTVTGTLEAAAKIINAARKPLIVWGQGIVLSEAEVQFKAFVEKAGIPAAWTILGASALPTSHPLNVGMLGMHGNYAPNKLTNECDVLIAIGMRFDDRVTGKLDEYARQAKVIHFEIDPAEIDKNVNPRRSGEYRGPVQRWKGRIVRYASRVPPQWHAIHPPGQRGSTSTARAISDPVPGD